jgi:hypothetical protein
MIPVEGHKNLYRDEKSGAIVNYDTLGYSQYIKMKSEKQKQKEEIDQIKTDIEEIKSCINHFILNPNLITKFGNAAQALAVNKFNSNTISKHWEKFYLNNIV